MRLKLADWLVLVPMNGFIKTCILQGIPFIKTYKSINTKQHHPKSLVIDTEHHIPFSMHTCTVHEKATRLKDAGCRRHTR